MTLFSFDRMQDSKEMEGQIVIRLFKKQSPMLLAYGVALAKMLYDILLVRCSIAFQRSKPASDMAWKRTVFRVASRASLEIRFFFIY